MAELDIDTVVTHNAQYWTVTEFSGAEHEVPQDPRNRMAKQVYRWIDQGGVPTSGESSKRAKVRRHLQNDPLAKAMLIELADMQGITPQAMAQKLLGHIT